MKIKMVYEATNLRDPIHCEWVYNERNALVVENGSPDYPIGTPVTVFGWTQVRPV